VYRDPETGVVLQVLHLERNWADGRYYTELHLGLVDTCTCTFPTPASTGPAIRRSPRFPPPVHPYYNGLTHHVTTGAPAAGYRSEGGWRLLDSAQPGTAPLYRCHIPHLAGHFVSTDSDCENPPGSSMYRQEGLLGYVMV
jgi:hypothetical protein